MQSEQSKSHNLVSCFFEFSEFPTIFAPFHSSLMDSVTQNGKEKTEKCHTLEIRRVWLMHHQLEQFHIILVHRYISLKFLTASVTINKPTLRWISETKNRQFSMTAKDIYMCVLVLVKIWAVLQALSKAI
jgi:hypothetical protein